MKLELFYPIKPYFVTQGFGLNPQYYTKFGIKAHNGLDLLAIHGQPVYAAHDGLAYWEKDENQGEGVVLRTNEVFDYDGDPNYSQVYFKTVYWHLCSGIKEPQFASPIWKAFKGEGIPVKCGDLIGYADNTGAPYESTGDHLHFGLKPQLPGEPNGIWYNVNQNNGFAGAINPTPYFNGEYAENYKLSLQAINIEKGVIDLSQNPQVDNQTKLDLIQKVVLLVNQLLKYLKL